MFDIRHRRSFNVDLATTSNVIFDQNSESKKYPSKGIKAAVLQCCVEL